MKELGIKKGEWIQHIVDETTVEINAEGWYGMIVVYVGTKDKDGNINSSDKGWNNLRLVLDAGNTAQKCGLLPSELLRQRDELREALAEQKRLYFNLFDEEVGCMYCEAKLKRGSAIILCKECAENTEV